MAARMLSARAFDAPALQTLTRGMDAATAWAAVTGLRDHLRAGEAAPERLPIVLELRPGVDAATLASHGIDVPPAHRAVAGADDLRRVSAQATPEAFAALARGEHASRVRRFELALPVVPHRARPRPARAASAAGADAARAASTSDVLLGVIDTGCPFAHPMLRDAAGTGTRILHLWDQDPHPAFLAVGGHAPADFGYGATIDRTSLNTLMRTCADARAPRRIDEARCYERAGLPELRQRWSHGSGVLGLLVAPRPRHESGQRLRHAPARAMMAPHDRPRSGGDLAARADIVFVQIPRDSVQDSSSAATPRYVIDGLRFILSCARPGQRVVINLSDGTSRGPHDGSSIVERAIEETIAREWARGREVHVVLGAGNTHDEERHAQFDRLAPDRPQAVTLMAPPDNESPVFVHLRVPAAALPRLRVRVSPPGAASGAHDEGSATAGSGIGWWRDTGDARGPCAGLILPAAPVDGDERSDSVMGLLVMAPTRRGERPAHAETHAPGGRWRIECALDGAGPPLDEPLHLWISRGQRNSGALPRARQARFLDTTRGYDPAPHLQHAEADPTPPRSPLRRAGTLNGLAGTPAGRGIVVVGATRRRERRPPCYSAAGPMPAPGRPGPDLCAPVDENEALPGVLAAGTRGAITLRATGTSFAAPQVARLLANRPPPPAVRPARRRAAPALPPLDPRLGAMVLEEDDDGAMQAHAGVLPRRWRG